MALMDMPDHASPSRRGEARQAALMLVVLYPGCLAAAAFSRLAREPAEARAAPSIWAEARASAAACVAFAFR